MNRKRASVRREEILAATVEEIEVTGLRTLRVADVAKRLGVSPSLVIYHFVTKESLVAAAFSHAGENDIYRARRIVASKKPVLDRLDSLISWYLPTGSTRSWRIWIDGWSAGLFDPHLKESFTLLHRQWTQVLTEVITQGRASGDFALAEVDAAVQRILAYMDGLAVQMVFHGSTLTRADAETWVRDFARVQLGLPATALPPSR